MTVPFNRADALECPLVTCLTDFLAASDVVDLGSVSIVPRGGDIGVKKTISVDVSLWSSLLPCSVILF
jgi:hypothetical protein